MINFNDNLTARAGGQEFELQCHARRMRDPNARVIARADDRTLAGEVVASVL